MNYRHCCLFFVEDDDDFAILLKRALLKAGVPDRNVRRYGDGEAALAALISIEVIRPSAILLDMELPGMSGLSLLERVRACEGLKNLPAYFLSGREDHRCVAAACALGARGYWVKPQSTAILQEIVGAILGSLDGVRPVALPGSLLNGR